MMGALITGKCKASHQGAYRTPRSYISKKRTIARPRLYHGGIAEGGNLYDLDKPLIEPLLENPRNFNLVYVKGEKRC